MTRPDRIPERREPVLPAYGGGCVTDIVPALLGPGPQDAAGPLPDEVLDARAVVLLVLDGMGAEQLAACRRVAPTLAEMKAATVTTVAPSTTASALTSIATGVPPGEHGIVGYRIRTHDGNLNALKWRTPQGDSLDRHPPERFQPVASFGGQRPPALQKDEYRGSGLSRAYLRDARPFGYKMLSSLPVEVRRLLRAGESFVYAYYEGLDMVAHEHGFGEHYEAELRACDRLVADLLTILPKGAAVVATADHGLVDCSDGNVKIDRSVLDCADAESGEARFRWLHARPGRARDLYEAAVDAHGQQAWVRTASEIIDGGWLGPVVTDAARSRLGDVALVACEAWAFAHPDDGTPRLVGRHGSLTSAEMLVPLLTYVS